MAKERKDEAQKEKRETTQTSESRSSLPVRRGQRMTSPLGRGIFSSPLGAWTSPFGFVRRMMEDMDRLFEDFEFDRELLPDIGPRVGGMRALTPSRWLPDVDIFRREGQLVVQADLPGLRPEDVHVQVTDDSLILEGERRSERETEEGGVYRSERSYGKFYREIPLPAGVDANAVNATFNNGVLEVSVKVPEQARRGREIPIGTGTKEPSAQVSASKGEQPQAEEIH